MERLTRTAIVFGASLVFSGCATSRGYYHWVNDNPAADLAHDQYECSVTARQLSYQNPIIENQEFSRCMSMRYGWRQEYLPPPQQKAESLSNDSATTP
jgi:hypothetical protein